MRDYQLPYMRHLVGQLMYAAEDVRRRYIQRIERLHAEVRPDREYAAEYVFYRITGFRSDSDGQGALYGAALQADLRTLLADLGETVTFDASEAREPILTIDQLAERFQVSSKTISRWREQGLINRRYVFDGGKVRVGFPESAVEAFALANREQVVRGGQFSHLTEGEKQAIVRRARRLAQGGALTLSEVSRRLAARFRRSPETVRYTIRNYDERHPEDPVFADRAAVLTEKDRDLIYQAYLRGIPIGRLAARFGRTRSTVYRIVKEMRAREVLAEKTEYVDNPEFHEAGAEAAILSEPLDDLRPRHKGGRPPKVPRDLPPYLQGLYRLPLLTKEQEVALFRRYNYLKYRIARAKEGMDPMTVTARDLRRLNDLKRQALEVKDILIQSNLRLVVSIAKRHVGRSMNFFELVSDGNVSLMRAVEKFDYSKGNKFSTYASWAIIKNFARTIPEENYQLDRYVTGRDEMLDTAHDRRREAGEEVDAAATTRELVGRVLERLTERERRVIMSRFGLGGAAGPLRLEDVGRELGVTKERIRQIEARALDKLREMMDPETLELASSS